MRYRRLLCPSFLPPLLTVIPEARSRRFYVTSGAKGPSDAAPKPGGHGGASAPPGRPSSYVKVSLSSLLDAGVVTAGPRRLFIRAGCVCRLITDHATGQAWTVAMPMTREMELLHRLLTSPCF